MVKEEKKYKFDKLKLKNQITVLVLLFLMMSVGLFLIPILSLFGLDHIFTYNYLLFALSFVVYFCASFPFVYFSILFIKFRFLNFSKKRKFFSILLYCLIICILLFVELLIIVLV